MEILVVTAVLVSAFLPILHHTFSTTRATSMSQEEITARTALTDLFERFAGSDLDILSRFPPRATAGEPGEGHEPALIQEDPLLGDPGPLARAMGLTRELTFETVREPEPGRPGLYRLRAIVTWRSRRSRVPRRIESTRLLTRALAPG